MERKESTKFWRVQLYKIDYWEKLFETLDTSSNGLFFLEISVFIHCQNKAIFFSFFLSFFLLSLGLKILSKCPLEISSFIHCSNKAMVFLIMKKKKKKNHTYTNLEKLIIIGKSCLIMLLFYKKIVLFFSFSKSNNLWVELIIVFSFFLFFVDLHYERDLNFKQTL